MKNKAVIGIAIILGVLMLSASFGTVSAGQKVPAQFQAVAKSTSEPTGVTTTGGILVTSDSGIYHVFGAHRFGKCYLTIDGVKYEGRVDVNVDYVLNPLTMKMIQQYHKMKIIFLKSVNPTILSTDSVFEGVNTWTATFTGISWVEGIPKYSGVDGSTVDMHGLLHGSGDFEGYTLHLGVGTQSWVNIR